jgi:hypothetical protein
MPTNEILELFHEGQSSPQKKAPRRPGRRGY